MIWDESFYSLKLVFVNQNNRLDLFSLYFLFILLSVVLPLKLHVLYVISQTCLITESTRQTLLLLKGYPLSESTAHGLAQALLHVVFIDFLLLSNWNTHFESNELVFATCIYSLFSRSRTTEWISTREPHSIRIRFRASAGVLAVTVFFCFVPSNSYSTKNRFSPHLITMNRLLPCRPNANNEMYISTPYTSLLDKDLLQ